MGWGNIIGSAVSKLKPSGPVSAAEGLAAIRLAKISNVLKKALPYLKPAEQAELAEIYAVPGTLTEKLHRAGVFLANKKLGMPAPLAKPTTWNEIESYYTYALKTVDNKKIGIRFSEELLDQLRGNSLDSTKIMSELIKTLSQKSSFSVQKLGQRQITINLGEFSSSTHNMSCEIGRDGAIIIRALFIKKP